MLIRIDHITEYGLQIKAQRNASWVTNVPEIVNGTNELSLNKNIEIDCSVTKVLEEVNVSGLVQFGIRTQCSNCLKDVELDLKTDIDLTLTPKDKFEDNQVDVDHEFYEGELIDLSNYFREQIAINLPYRVICKENCKGLCAECGVDLNIEKCGCERNLNDSAFAVLKYVKV